MIDPKLVAAAKALTQKCPECEATMVKGSKCPKCGWHAEPDADDRGGPSDGDADNG